MSTAHKAEHAAEDKEAKAQADADAKLHAELTKKAQEQVEAEKKAENDKIVAARAAILKEAADKDKPVVKVVKTEAQVKAEALASAGSSALEDLLAHKKAALLESHTIEEIEAEIERRKTAPK